MDFEIPPSHPRYNSIMTRHKITDGFKAGITASAGVIAQGRGEAYDYLLGEVTTQNALLAIEAASALLLLAKNPILSVNGNSAILVPTETIELSRLLNSKMEINLFYRTTKREVAIQKHLLKNGAKKEEILGVKLGKNAVKIKELEHARGIIDKNGINIADVVLVPLEDGDRTIALKNLGKKVIAIDLNPFSRTPNEADISIIDNITRCMPLLIEKIKEFKEKNYSDEFLQKIVSDFDNKKNIQDSFCAIKENLTKKIEGKK